MALELCDISPALGQDFKCKAVTTQPAPEVACWVGRAVLLLTGRLRLHGGPSEQGHLGGPGEGQGDRAGAQPGCVHPVDISV